MANIFFAAFGCAEPELRGNELVKLTETEAHLKCDKSGQSEVLTCKGTEWSPTATPCVGKELAMHFQTGFFSESC